VIERKYLEMFDRLKREEASGVPRQPLERLPGWFARRRRDLPPASAVLAGIPSGAVSVGGEPARDLSQSA
jgi:hypothetical protein